MYWALIVFFGLGEVYGAQKDYCNVKCKVGIHTMCTKYYPPGGNGCKNYKVELSEKEIDDLLEDANQWRNSVALGKLYDLPSASNMIELRWDDEAASIAKRWAEQCDQVTEDDCRRLLLTSRDDGGQCIASSAAKDYQRPEVLRELMGSFFAMGKNMTNVPGSIDVYRPTSDEVKFFTQMAWAVTDRIGCAVSQATVGLGEAKYKLICNLYAEGNIKGRSVYLRGAPCSACPATHSQCSDKYSGLCMYMPRAPSHSSRLQSFLSALVCALFILVAVKQQFY